MPLSRPFAGVLDGDLHGGRPPQRASQFDPRWELVFFFGCGNPPYGMSAYMARGSGLWIPTVTGAISVATNLYGWGLNGTIAGSTYLTGTMNFDANLTRGAMVVVTNVVTALAATARHAFLAVSGTKVLECASNLATSHIAAGWFDGTTDTRVNVSNTGLTTANTLTVFSVDWSPTGTRLYINGLLAGSNASVPASWATNAGALRVGGTASGGWGDPVLAAAILDKALDANEHGYIARNPFTWAFQPSLLRNLASPPAGVLWGWEMAGGPVAVARYSAVGGSPM